MTEEITEVLFGSSGDSLYHSIYAGNDRLELFLINRRRGAL